MALSIVKGLLQHYVESLVDEVTDYQVGFNFVSLICFSKAAFNLTMYLWGLMLACMPFDLVSAV